MAKKSLSMKVVVLLMAAVLLIGCSVGGTLAWLIANSETVTNTFVVGDINIQLKETGAVKDENDGIFKNNNFKVLPGTTQAKDPQVIVEAGSEACWLFVQVKEENNTATSGSKYVTWTINSEWKELSTVGGVSTYYIELDAIPEDGSAVTKYVLAGDADYADGVVEYDSNLTKADMDELDEGAKQPQLTFKAFAVQKEAAGSAAEAWAEVDTGAKLG